MGNWVCLMKSFGNEELEHKNSDCLKNKYIAFDIIKGVRFRI